MFILVKGTLLTDKDCVLRHKLLSVQSSKQLRIILRQEIDRHKKKKDSLKLERGCTRYRCICVGFLFIQRLRDEQEISAPKYRSGQ